MNISGAAAKLFLGWQVFLRDKLKNYYDGLLHPPLLIDREVLNKTQYLDHFPHQLFAVQTHLNPHGRGQDRFVTPAACLHVYPQLENQKVTDLHTELVYATCGRVEDAKWQPPYRLPNFHMLELVTVGEADAVVRRRVELEKLVGDVFTGLGLKLDLTTATDAFFLGEQSGAQRIQKLKRLKKEFTLTIDGKQIALASINNHEDFFARRFNIRAPDEVAHSSCLAFGMERLAFASLNVWGDRENDWPGEFKQYADFS